MSATRSSSPARHERASVSEVRYRKVACAGGQAPPVHGSADAGSPPPSHDFGRIRPDAPVRPAVSPVVPGDLHLPTRQEDPNPTSASSSRTSVVEHDRNRIFVSIGRRRNPGSPRPVGQRALGRPGASSARIQGDGAPGAEQPAPLDLGLFAPALATGVQEPREGETIRLPDIVVPAGASVVQTDAVASALSYNPSITQSGPPPSPFGATLPYTHAITGITVTPSPGTYTVAATVDNPITFQVSGGGRPDIASATDPDITQANYSTVASDLIPDMSDLNGRPPRNSFWAEDLCIRHERFHATEDVTHGRSGVTLAQNWLNTKTAASVAEVNLLLGQVPARVAATVNTAMAYPGRELRAYGDGAPQYLARANAIKAKGDAGGYGGAPAPGMSRGAKTAIGIGGGALVGAGIGAVVGGPVGAAVGAGIGAIVGGVGSLLF